MIRLLLVLLQVSIHAQLQVKVQLIVALYSLPCVLVVVEPRQLQDQDGREQEERLLLLVHVKRDRVQAVVEVGVAFHWDKVGREDVLPDKKSIADSLCPAMSMEQPEYWIWIKPVKRSYTGAEPKIKK